MIQRALELAERRLGPALRAGDPLRDDVNLQVDVLAKSGERLVTMAR